MSNGTGGSGSHKSSPTITNSSGPSAGGNNTTTSRSPLSLQRTTGPGGAPANGARNGGAGRPQQAARMSGSLPPRQLMNCAPLNIENLPSRFNGQVKCLPPQCIPPCMPGMCPPFNCNPCYPYCPPPPCCYPPPYCGNPCQPPCPPPFCNPCAPPCPPPFCNPCCPPCPPSCPTMPRQCVARKPGCFGAGSTLVCLPRGSGPMPPQGMGPPPHGPFPPPMPLPFPHEQPASFNNCNFYVKEPPRGFGPNALGGLVPLPSSDKLKIDMKEDKGSGSGEFLLGASANDLKNIAAGDNKIVPPPLGYPGSNRLNAWEGLKPDEKPSKEKEDQENVKKLILKNPEDERMPNGQAYKSVNKVIETQPEPPPVKKVLKELFTGRTMGGGGGRRVPNIVQTPQKKTEVEHILSESEETEPVRKSPNEYSDITTAMTDNISNNRNDFTPSTRAREGVGTTSTIPSSAITRQRAPPRPQYTSEGPEEIVRGKRVLTAHEISHLAQNNILHPRKIRRPVVEHEELRYTYMGGPPKRHPNARFCIPTDYHNCSPPPDTQGSTFQQRQYPPPSTRRLKRKPKSIVENKHRRLKTLCENCHSRYLINNYHAGLPMPKPTGSRNDKSSNYHDGSTAYDTSADESHSPYHPQQSQHQNQVPAPASVSHQSRVNRAGETNVVPNANVQQYFQPPQQSNRTIGAIGGPQPQFSLPLSVMKNPHLQVGNPATASSHLTDAERPNYTVKTTSAVTLKRGGGKSDMGETTVQGFPPQQSNFTKSTSVFPGKSNRKPDVVTIMAMAQRMPSSHPTNHALRTSSSVTLSRNIAPHHTNQIARTTSSVVLTRVATNPHTGGILRTTSHIHIVSTAKVAKDQCLPKCMMKCLPEPPLQERDPYQRPTAGACGRTSPYPLSTCGSPVVCSLNPTPCDDDNNARFICEIQSPCSDNSNFCAGPTQPPPYSKKTLCENSFSGYMINNYHAGLPMPKPFGRGNDKFGNYNVDVCRPIPVEFHTIYQPQPQHIVRAQSLITISRTNHRLDVSPPRQQQQQPRYLVKTTSSVILSKTNRASPVNPSQHWAKSQHEHQLQHPLVRASSSVILTRTNQPANVISVPSQNWPAVQQGHRIINTSSSVILSRTNTPHNRPAPSQHLPVPSQPVHHQGRNLISSSSSVILSRHNYPTNNVTIPLQAPAQHHQQASHLVSSSSSIILSMNPPNIEIAPPKALPESRPYQGHHDVSSLISITLSTTKHPTTAGTAPTTQHFPESRPHHGHQIIRSSSSVIISRTNNPTNNIHMASPQQWPESHQGHHVIDASSSVALIRNNNPRSHGPPPANEHQSSQNWPEIHQGHHVIRSSSSIIITRANHPKQAEAPPQYFPESHHQGHHIASSSVIITRPNHHTHAINAPPQNWADTHQGHHIVRSSSSVIIHRSNQPANTISAPMQNWPETHQGHHVIRSASSIIINHPTHEVAAPSHWPEAHAHQPHGHQMVKSLVTISLSRTKHPTTVARGPSHWEEPEAHHGHHLVKSTSSVLISRTNHPASVIISPSHHRPEAHQAGHGHIVVRTSSSINHHPTIASAPPQNWPAPHQGHRVIRTSSSVVVVRTNHPTNDVNNIPSHHEAHQGQHLVRSSASIAVSRHHPHNVVTVPSQHYPTRPSNNQVVRTSSSIVMSRTTGNGGVNTVTSHVHVISIHEGEDECPPKCEMKCFPEPPKRNRDPYNRPAAGACERSAPYPLSDCGSPPVCSYNPMPYPPTNQCARNNTFICELQPQSPCSSSGSPATSVDVCNAEYFCVDAPLPPPPGPRKKKRKGRIKRRILRVHNEEC